MRRSLRVKVTMDNGHTVEIDFDEQANRIAESMVTEFVSKIRNGEFDLYAINEPEKL